MNRTSSLAGYKAHGSSPLRSQNARLGVPSSCRNDTLGQLDRILSCRQLMEDEVRGSTVAEMCSPAFPFGGWVFPGIRMLRHHGIGLVF